MVGTRAGLHADQARRQVFEEDRDLIAPRLLAQDRFAVRVHSVDLKDILRKIDPDCLDLHRGRPFRFEWSMTRPLRHVDAVIGWGRLIGYGYARRAEQGGRGLPR
jgi:hypothetical protein